MATDYASMIPKEDLASFQKANPNLTFGAQDYTAYNNATINSQNLAQGPSLKTSTYQPTPVDPNIAPSMLSQVAGQFEAVNMQNERALQEQQANRDQQNNLSSALLNKTADTQAAQEQAGVNAARASQDQYTQQIYDLNAQASSLTKEAQAASQNAIKEGRQFGSVQSFVTSQQGEIERNRAIKALEISANADVAQAALLGSQLKLQSAKEKAQQIIDLKYKPMEDMLAMKKDQYEKNKEILASIDKKRTEALNATIKKEEKDIEERKANEKGIADLVTNAAGQGAPADLRAKAAKAKTPMEAANILGVYAGDYLVNKKITAEINKMDAEAAKTRSEANGAGINGATSSSAKAWLDQYNSGALSLEDIYTKIGSTKEAGVLKNQVAQLVAAQGGKRKYGADDASVQAINAQIKNVNDLLYGNGKTEADKTTGGVGKIVGVVQGGGGIFLPDSLNVGKQDALAVAKNLVSNQTLQALADAKSKGITFGALSEGELGLVSDAASSIASKLIKDKDGNITGFSGSESQFKKDLLKVKEGLQKSIKTKTGNSGNQAESTADDIMTANKKVRAVVDNTYSIFN